MNASFGIDHPLIATHDIAALRNRLISLGFTMTPVGQHPWGTTTSLAMFQGCLIEIMGIYDDKLLDHNPAGDFRFGRHIHRHLQAREGVALTALHSSDAQADAATAMRAGLSVAGHLEFGRDVTLPDGRSGRTKTSLVLLPNATFPRLSFFLCQQHRPDLIYVPAWLDHPNSAQGIAGVTIRAEAADQPALRTMLSALYGAPSDVPGGFCVPTANGTITVLTGARIAAIFGPLPPDLAAQTDPGIVAMDIRVNRLDRAQAWCKTSGLDWRADADAVTLTNAAATGNMFLRFLKPPA
jgi:Glyoxalase-like domain